MQRVIARSHLLRAGRVSLPGQAYLVTTRTVAREPLLGHFAAARATVRSLRDCSGLGFALTLAFVVMPDHVHWLLQLGGHPLAVAVQRFKGRAARAINAGRGRSGPVWQPGFQDHALRREENLAQVARYLLLNPVRAGLVRHPMQWPHWFIDDDTWPLLASDLEDN